MDSSDTKSMMCRAALHIEDEDFDGALRIFDMILSQDPHNLDALVEKGTVLQNLGRVADAIQYYDAVIDMSPCNPDALLNKGIALHAKGRYRDAIDCYDLILESKKNHTIHAMLYKGLSLGELGDLKEAIMHFESVLDVDSDMALARVSRDTAQKLLGES